MLIAVRLGLVFGMLILSAPRATAQLTFNITNQGGASAQMVTGFTQAAALWSAVLNDPITINIKIHAAALPAGQIAGTNPFFDPYSYTATRNALLNDRTSAGDFSSANALQAGSSISMLINRTANNPNGIVSATPYFDTGLGGAGQAGIENNNTIRMTTANSKALGLLPGNFSGSDGTITFTTVQSYDYDRSNGINASQIDFVGVAAHEIGHLLGFLSGVEVLDGNGASPGLNDNQLKFVTPLDLFRFSTRGIGTGGGVGVIDFTADNTTKYFSVDGGVTPYITLSNGSDFGDGFEAHHWKNNQGNGIMDPTAASGGLLAILATDVAAFDVIGYNMVPTPEPPCCLALAFAGLAAAALWRGRARLLSAAN